MKPVKIVRNYCFTSIIECCANIIIIIKHIGTSTAHVVPVVYLFKMALVLFHATKNIKKT